MFFTDDLSREPVNINRIGWTLQPTIDISSKIAVTRLGLWSQGVRC